MKIALLGAAGGIGQALAQAQAQAQAGVYQPQKLFGITTLDVTRANSYVAAMKGLRPDQIEVPVVGGHSGVTILPLLSQMPGITFSDEDVNILTRRILNACTEVVEAKASAGSATLAMGMPWPALRCRWWRALQGVSARRPLGIFSDFEQQALQCMREALNQDIALGEQFL